MVAALCATPKKRGHGHNCTHFLMYRILSEMFSNTMCSIKSRLKVKKKCEKYKKKQTKSLTLVAVTVLPLIRQGCVGITFFSGQYYITLLDELVPTPSCNSPFFTAQHNIAPY